MDISELRPGQRYLFHYKRENEREWFRANFITLVTYGNYKTLIVDKYENETNPMNPGQQWCISLEMISKVETLPCLLKSGDVVLPDDVLLLVDNYF
jgi:hypothetical protein